MKYLLAHDLGTTGDKATLYSEDGTLIKSIIAEYPTHYGKHGVVEQNPEDWWKAVCETTSAMACLLYTSMREGARTSFFAFCFM